MSVPERARPRVLVVEDEEHLAEGMQLNFAAEGYDVAVARTGTEALARWREGGIDAIVLDVMLPELSGFSVCEQIRQAGSNVPIIFLTARGRAEDRVRGFELGGDDYLAKPFHLRELLLRVRALLRRRDWTAPDPTTSTRVRFGPCEVDLGTGDCLERGGERGRLTPKELGILKLLMEEPGRPARREDVVRRVWDPAEEPPTARTIDNFILRLRKRFEEDPRRPQFLQTVFGVGYRFVP